jgi:serine/threonine-protein kinase
LPDDPDPAGATRLLMAGDGGGGAAIAPGTLLCHGTYRIEEWLGAGGMGEVYRGVNIVTGSSCAIKTIRPELVADPC